MSLESWRAEFYAVPASGAMGSDLEAARHSLRKWEGVKPEVLARHGLECFDAIVRDGDGGAFQLTSATCALCVRVDEVCGDCIGTRANDLTCSSRPETPWHQFYNTGDPEPMIAWLRKAVELAEKEARL